VVVVGVLVGGVVGVGWEVGGERTVVIGVGTNVNLEPEELADLPNATSLSIEAGHAVHRGELLALMLERLDSWLKRHPREREDGIWRAWNGRLWGRDQIVRLQDGAEQIRATITGGDRDGTLLVRMADGSSRRIVAGEILP
jgi:biotin-(acetyl-CoA carboxylase) ligase